MKPISFSFLGLIFSFLLFNFQISVPSLYVIGDSISMQYGPYLEEYTRGEWQYSRKGDNGEGAKNLDVPVGANGGHSAMVLSFLKTKLEDANFQPDILLINCGLHDIKRDAKTNKIQIDSASYRANLKQIIELSRGRSIQLVWVRTTPVEDERHNSRSKEFKRYARDLDVYNAIADEVMANYHIPSIDLYSFTKSLGGEHFVDHVHYDVSTRAAHAAYIAGFLQAAKASLLNSK